MTIRKIISMCVSFTILIVSLTFSSRYSGDANAIGSGSFESRSYRVHTYFTNSNDYTSYFTYTIQNSRSLSDDANELRTIFGDNDMIPDSNTAVVNIGNNGTGFIVGPHIIATAAHVVYNVETGAFTNGMVYITDQSGNIITTIAPYQIHVPVLYATSSLYDYGRTMADYALIYVNDSLTNYGIFKLGIPNDSLLNSSGTVTVSGYPQIPSQPSSIVPYGYSYGMRYKASGNLYSTNLYIDPQYMLHYNADMAPGDSGGPVYVDDDYYANGVLVSAHTAIGINTAQMGNTVESTSGQYKYNQGIKIIPEIYRFYMGNPLYN